MSRPPQSFRLHIKGLSCQLGNNTILPALTLPYLQGGELVALLGANGSGKTTLLSSLACLAQGHFDALLPNELERRGLPDRARAQKIRRASCDEKESTYV